jgi:hypothetical protein
MAIFPKQFVKVPGSGTGAGSAGTWKAPRLSRALIYADAGELEGFQTPLDKAVRTPKEKGGRAKVTLREAEREKFDAELRVLVGHIRARLEGTLDEAWMSSEGYDSAEFRDLLIKARKENKKPSEAVEPSNADLVDAAKFYDSPEESWARAFCEKVVFSMYHTPGQIYGTPQNDAPWFSRYPEWYSIAMACQTLSTYALLSRGFDFKAGDVGKNGLACSAGTASMPAFKDADRDAHAQKRAEEAAKKKHQPPPAPPPAPAADPTLPATARDKPLGADLLHPPNPLEISPI